MDECIIPLLGDFGEYINDDDIVEILEIKQNIKMLNLQKE